MSSDPKMKVVETIEAMTRDIRNLENSMIANQRNLENFMVESQKKLESTLVENQKHFFKELSQTIWESLNASLKSLIGELKHNNEGIEETNKATFEVHGESGTGQQNTIRIPGGRGSKQCASTENSRVESSSLTILKACSSIRSAKRLQSNLGLDGFSKLPDDIITSSILPHLASKEQRRTSVLSRRWRNLWKSSHSIKLVFPHGMDNLPSPKLEVDNRRPTYIRWVNATLASFRGLELLDEFHISFELDRNCCGIVDAWLDFAFGKGVKRLHLDLGPFCPLPNYRYTFPTTEKLSRFSLGGFGCHGGSGALSKLMDISLRFVNIEDDTLQYLLSSCPCLERIGLSAVTAGSKQTLHIVGTSLNLRFLELTGCIFGRVKYVISAPKLVSLKFDGLNKYLLLINVPLLVRLCLSGQYIREFVKFRPFNDFCQVKELEMDMDSWQITTSSTFPLEFPELLKLEELKVRMVPVRGIFLLWPTLLVKAAPILKRCTIELRGDMDDVNDGFGVEYGAPKAQRDKIREATKCKHRHLKVVEVTGFRHWDNQVELVEHLLSLAHSLQKLVLGLSSRFGDRYKQSYANKFSKHLPSDAKVVLL